MSVIYIEGTTVALSCSSSTTRFTFTVCGCPCPVSLLIFNKHLHHHRCHTSRSTKRSSIPKTKSILNLDVFRPERLKNLDDDALDVALHPIHPFVRPDTVKFVLEEAMERKGCIEFLYRVSRTISYQRFELYR
jgi:hypothetical protein